MKLSRKVALVVIACLCAIVCLIGCAGQTKAVVTSYGGEVLEIKVRFKDATAEPRGTHFYSSNTLSELKEQIDKQKQKGYSLETTLYGERYLLVDKTVDNQIYHYSLVRLMQTSEGGWTYRFANMVASVGNLQDEKTSWQIPFHLFGDYAYEELFDSTYLTDPTDATGEYLYVTTDHAYSIEYGIDEFYDFYKAVENYAVTREENVITLQKPYSDSIKLRFDETQSGTTVTYFNSVFVE